MVSASPLPDSGADHAQGPSVSHIKRKIEEIDGHGSSSASANGDDGPESSAAALRRAADSLVAKLGTIVPGSGDGTDCGDECYIWTDLPMNKQGALPLVYSVTGYEPSQASDIFRAGRHQKHRHRLCTHSTVRYPTAPPHP